MHCSKLYPLDAAVLGAGLIATSPAALAESKLPPLAVDAAFNAPEMAGKLLNISDLTALKDLKRVALTLFTVEFTTADNVSSQTSGFAAAGRASSTMYFKLLGVGEGEFQAITNGLHQRLLAELQASGLVRRATSRCPCTPGTSSDPKAASRRSVPW